MVIPALGLLVAITDLGTYFFTLNFFPIETLAWMAPYMLGVDLLLMLSMTIPSLVGAWFVRDKFTQSITTDHTIEEFHI